MRFNRFHGFEKKPSRRQPGFIKSRRRGVSEVIITALLAGVTLAVGVAAFIFVNSGAAVSENALGQSWGATASFLNERFVVVNMNFSSSCSPTCSVSLWIYNNGKTTLQITQVVLYNSSGLSVVYSNSASGSQSCSYVPGTSTLQKPSLGSFVLSQGKVGKLTLQLPDAGHGCAKPGTFKSGQAYYVNVLAIYGNIVNYFQTR